jgi:hypothetical protein
MHSGCQFCLEGATAAGVCGMCSSRCCDMVRGDTVQGNIGSWTARLGVRFLDCFLAVRLLRCALLVAYITDLVQGIGGS